MRSEILVGGGERDYATPQKVKLKYANRRFDRRGHRNRQNRDPADYG